MSNVIRTVYKDTTGPQSTHSSSLARASHTDTRGTEPTVLGISQWQRWVKFHIFSISATSDGEEITQQCGFVKCSPGELGSGVAMSPCGCLISCHLSAFRDRSDSEKQVAVTHLTTTCDRVYTTTKCSRHHMQMVFSWPFCLTFSKQNTSCINYCGAFDESGWILLSMSRFWEMIGFVCRDRFDELFVFALALYSGLSSFVNQALEIEGRILFWI